MAGGFAGHEVDEMVRLYVDHRWPVWRIAEKFSSSYGTVRKILNAQGVLRRKPGRKFNTEEIDKIVTLYVQHKWCVNDVAAEVGAPPITVYRLLRRRGLNRSRGEAQTVRHGTDARIDHIYRLLRAMIVSGILLEGAPLPSQEELRKLFGVGGQALRDAIYDLEYDGYIITVKPYGTFVCPRENWKVSSDLNPGQSSGPQPSHAP